MQLFKKRELHNTSCKAFFLASIDFNRDYRNRIGHNLVSLPKKYEFDENLEETYDGLKKFAISVLENKLPEECKQLVGIPICKVKVERVYEGSIELCFTIPVEVINIAKDLSIDIITKLLAVAISKILLKYFETRYGPYFDIDVKSINSVCQSFNYKCPKPCFSSTLNIMLLTIIITLILSNAIKIVVR